MSMELKACREALKSGNKPAADDLLCVKAFSMEQVKAIEEKDGRIICDFILSNGAVDRLSLIHIYPAIWIQIKQSAPFLRYSNGQNYYYSCMVFSFLYIKVECFHKI